VQANEAAGLESTPASGGFGVGCAQPGVVGSAHSLQVPDTQVGLPENGQPQRPWVMGAMAALYWDRPDTLIAAPPHSQLPVQRVPAVIVAQSDDRLQDVS
jgi:hypothetical protein